MTQPTAEKTAADTLRRHLKAAAQRLRTAAEVIDGEAALLDKVDALPPTTPYASIACNVQHEVWSATLGTQMDVLTRYAGLADLARITGDAS